MDKLTKLQDQVDTSAKLFYSAVGVLQQNAPPIRVGDETWSATTTGVQDMHTPEDSLALAKKFAHEIVASTKAVDALIRQLPGTRHCEQHQLNRLEELERENQTAGEDLKLALAAAEQWQSRVRVGLNKFSDKGMLSSIK